MFEGIELRRIQDSKKGGEKNLEIEDKRNTEVFNFKLRITSAKCVYTELDRNMASVSSKLKEFLERIVAQIEDEYFIQRLELNVSFPKNRVNYNSESETSRQYTFNVDLKPIKEHLHSLITENFIANQAERELIIYSILNREIESIKRQILLAILREWFNESYDKYISKLESKHNDKLNFEQELEIIFQKIRSLFNVGVCYGPEMVDLIKKLTGLAFLVDLRGNEKFDKIFELIKANGLYKNKEKPEDIYQDYYYLGGGNVEEENLAITITKLMDRIKASGLPDFVIFERN